jgi:hypothetical protein
VEAALWGWRRAKRRRLEPTIGLERFDGYWRTLRLFLYTLSEGKSATIAGRLRSARKSQVFAWNVLQLTVVLSWSTLRSKASLVDFIFVANEPSEMQEISDRVPLVVGVTGHRDLRPEDIPILEKEFGNILRRLQTDYQGSAGTDAPLVLVSALAEGADRLAARVALSMEATLVAAIPMPSDEYRRDFETAAVQAEFDQLMERAFTTRVMGFVPGNTVEKVRTDPVCRAKQYRAVGVFIVQQCNVLIALWDGNDDRAMGGTAEVVAFKREGIPLGVSQTAGSSLDGSEIGPVIHLVTPRRKSGTPATQVFVLPWGKDLAGNRLNGKPGGATDASRPKKLEGARGEAFDAGQQRDIDAWETFDALNALTREFNRDAREFESTASTAAEDSANALFAATDRPGDSAVREYASNDRSRWRRLFGIADALAKMRQAQFRTDWMWLFLISLAGFFLFAFADHFGFNLDRGLLPAYLLALYFLAGGAGFGLLRRVRKRRDQERFLDYRALAEALRVAIYWHILSIVRPDSAGEVVDQRKDAVNGVADLYPIKQPSELTWVKNTLRALALCHRQPDKAQHQMNDATAYHIVRQYWVLGQENYFKQQRERHDRRSSQFEFWSIVCFTFTLVFVVAMFFSVFGLLTPLDTQLPVFGPLRIRDLLLIASGLLPGIAAALTGYSERLAYAAQANQYDRMRLLFKRAHDLLPEELTEDMQPAAWSVFRQLGMEAMKESADWVSIYRQRPIKSLQ